MSIAIHSEKAKSEGENESYQCSGHDELEKIQNMLNRLATQGKVSR